MQSNVLIWFASENITIKYNQKCSTIRVYLCQENVSLFSNLCLFHILPRIIPATDNHIFRSLNDI